MVVLQDFSHLNEPIITCPRQRDCLQQASYALTDDYIISKVTKHLWFTNKCLQHNIGFRNQVIENSCL